MTGQHLVFYDGECGFCDHVVQFLLKTDAEGIFHFAPLQGTTAQKVLGQLLPSIREADTLVLVENYKTPQQQFFILGKGAFRIYWLLGGAWTLLGWINFLPHWLYDWGYRLVARNRHLFFSRENCVLPNPAFKGRFLP